MRIINLKSGIQDKTDDKKQIQFILLAAAAIWPALRHASHSQEGELLSNT